jgi:bifunctional DNA-binding transcriptional regulator/antitoxin component of YhaV-PrlF toxin-antitoxin module
MKMRYKTKKTRKITKVGGYSYAITLPREIVKKFKWREKQKVELIIDESKEEIIVRDYEP